ncbi:MAG: 4-(cytidine 5'-diphospho)-2-C-methyl-D-erythritol kinase [Alphaproteobacteria bacterium]|nr:4-(cytidine 5'-diphospho)-2-C-methyl-D-erythritol kinase [Alphaproteobacteria bacterium]
MAYILETARAKINLALHVTGQREDGYHLIESLVTFADLGDQLSFSPDQDWRFSQSGPFAGDLTADNLVLRARDKLRDAAMSMGIEIPPVAIHLEKNLPVAAGLGGGSADAAACLRGLLRFWNLSETSLPFADLALELGADVPMCLMSQPLVASGIGEKVTRLTTLPALSMVLVNPRVAISTPEVFGQLQRKDNPSMTVPQARSTDALARELQQLRNDLQAPAASIAPVVTDVIGTLSKTGALLTRMSGSGATCFGVYPDRNAASSAAGSLRALHPAWYVEACTTKAD